MKDTISLAHSSWNCKYAYLCVTKHINGLDVFKYNLKNPVGMFCRKTINGIFIIKKRRLYYERKSYAHRS